MKRKRKYIVENRRGQSSDIHLGNQDSSHFQQERRIGMKKESEMCRNWRLSLLGDVSRIKIYRRGPTKRNPKRYVVIQEFEKGDHHWMSFVYVNNVHHFKKKVEIHSWKTTDDIMLHFFEWDDKLEWVFDDSVTSRPKKKLTEIPKVHMSLRHPEIEIYDHEFWLIELICSKWWFPLF